MISNLEDYKKIRDVLLSDGNDNRITIDNKVLHTREQCRISRNIDQYYLTELKSLYDANDLDNSIEFPYPIPLETKLKYPDISKYIDKKKLDEVNVDVTDKWIYTGGKDPDIDALRKQDDELLDKQSEDIRDEGERWDEEQQKLLEEHLEKLKNYQTKLEDLEDEFKDIVKDYEEELEELNEENDDALKKLDEEKADINKDLSSGNIDIPKWNELMYELEEKYYEQEKNFIRKRTGNEIELYTKQADFGNRKYEILSDEKKENKDYEKDLSEKRDDHDEKVQDILDNTAKGRNSIFLKSNGYCGTTFDENYSEMKKDLLECDVYPAAKNVDKAIPWISSKEVENYIEYNNRLMADWENCRWKKVSVSIEKKIAGIMEHYTSSQTYQGFEGQYGTNFPGYTATSSFDRFVDCDYLKINRTYTPQEGTSATQDSEFTIINNEFKVRFGNRTQLDNIDKMLILVRCHGSGEDGFGRKYGFVEAKYKGVQAKEWLDQIDEENDLHLENIQEIDDDFNEDANALRIEYENDLYDLEMKAKLDLEDNEYEYYKAVGGQRKAFITQTDELRIQSNSLAAQGEDNSQLIQQISSLKSQFLSQIYQTRVRYDDLARDINDTLRKDKRDRGDRYSTEYDDLRDDMEEDKRDEDERHSDVLKDIRDDYVDRADDFREQAQEEYDNVEEEQRKKLEELDDKHREQKESLNKSLVEKWNNKYEDYEIDEDYNFWTDGRPEDPGDEDAGKFYESGFSLPMYNMSVAQGLAVDKAIDAKNSALAKAHQKYLEKMDEWEILDENNRYLFTFDASGFSEFSNEFSSVDEDSAWGESSCSIDTVVQAYVHLDFGAETGATFPDYDEIDNPTDDQDKNEGQA